MLPLRSGLCPPPAGLAEELTRHGVPRRLCRNVIVVTAGEPAETLYFVLEGNLVAYLADESGKEIELGRMGPGEYFGELMLASDVRTASVRTLTPARLSVVRRQQFEQILSEHQDFSFHVIQTLVGRVRNLADRVHSLALMDVYGRVAKLLDESAAPCGPCARVVELSQHAIADQVAASPSMVNRILHDLIAGGYVAASRGRIELLKPLPRRW